MTRNVEFEEPLELRIEPRTLISREPGVLSQRLLNWGLARNVTQAKILIAFVVIGGFMVSTYLLEGALSGPDIPARPPSPLYADYIESKGR